VKKIILTFLITSFISNNLYADFMEIHTQRLGAWMNQSIKDGSWDPTKKPSDYLKRIGKSYIDTQINNLFFVPKRKESLALFIVQSEGLPQLMIEASGCYEKPSRNTLGEFITCYKGIEEIDHFDDTHIKFSITRIMSKFRDFGFKRRPHDQRQLAF